MARGGLWLGGYLGPTTYLGPPVPLGRAGEGSSAPPMRRLKRRPLGRGDGGFGVAAFGDKPFGSPTLPAVDTQLARPVARRKLRLTLQAAEAGAAARVRPLKRKRIGPGRDKQRARPMHRRTVLEPVVEHATARAVRPVKRRHIGQAVELAATSSRFRPPAGYGEGPYGGGPYGGEVADRARVRKVRRIGPGRDRQRARPIDPT